MTRRPGGARSGITLTEVLISILIMGVGLISLATLFPLGMVRLRAANQQHRSGLLGESATADLSALNLLYKPSFFLSWYSAASSPYPAGAYDPFTVDPLPGGAGGLSSSTFGPGLPVCYDPLWRFETGVTPSVGLTTGEARFGQGVFLKPTATSFLRADPDKGTASGYGLQRVTNYASIAGWSFVNPETVFVSPDDPVLQNSDATPQILSAANTTNNLLSGVVPTNFGGANPFQNDFRYTWMFTGYQVDATNGTAFVGDVVVMDSRPFSFETVTSPVDSTKSAAAASGETVMEAIFGYSTSVLPAAGPGYGVAADRTVLLRWPQSMPDPEIKVGSWIADVTYERNLTTSNTRVGNALSAGVAVYPFQRCHWYQVSKKGEVQSDPDVSDSNSVPYRRMIVGISSPLKARTLLNAGGTAVNINVALFMPSVVNAFQRAIFVRTDR